MGHVRDVPRSGVVDAVSVWQKPPELLGHRLEDVGALGPGGDQDRAGVRARAASSTVRESGASSSSR